MNGSRCVLAALMLCAASASWAQNAGAADRLLPRVIGDVRVATVGLPTGVGWTPSVASVGSVPGRGLGFEAGAHLYVLRFGIGAVGVGATYTWGRGSTSANPELATPTAGVTTRLSLFSPQLSLNFGHRLGWSYVSGGIGRASESSEITDPLAGRPRVAPAESGWTGAINYGGGARWFFKDRIAVSLDLRWYTLSSADATPTGPALPKQSLLVASGGISIQ
jgi:hypothetical protein